jgi:hypothetical protein
MSLSPETLFEQSSIEISNLILLPETDIFDIEPTFKSVI